MSLCGDGRGLGGGTSSQRCEASFGAASDLVQGARERKSKHGRSLKAWESEFDGCSMKNEV